MWAIVDRLWMAELALDRSAADLGDHGGTGLAGEGAD